MHLNLFHVSQSNQLRFTETFQRQCHFFFNDKASCTVYLVYKFTVSSCFDIWLLLIMFFNCLYSGSDFGLRYRGQKSLEDRLGRNEREFRDIGDSRYL